MSILGSAGEKWFDVFFFKFFILIDFPKTYAGGGRVTNLLFLLYNISHLHGMSTLSLFSVLVVYFKHWGACMALCKQYEQLQAIYID